jgi:hypothetical protein
VIGRRRQDGRAQGIPEIEENDRRRIAGCHPGILLLIAAAASSCAAFPQLM